MAFEFNPARGFGVYIHWPYCTRICPYCDFNVYAAKARDGASLVGAILADLAGWRAASGPRVVDTIFFGGGTPSLLSGADIARLIDQVEQLWGVAGDREITLEANPDDRARFADFAAAGIDRLSLGVQSLKDETLGFLGRTHSGSDALDALKAALGKFRSVSLDLIYALPGQAPALWRQELGEALKLGADHLSLYELTIEPGAAFARAVKRRDWTPINDDDAADLYELTQELTETAGYRAYEISNHARSAEHQSRHNQIYWRSGDWAGVGPGAHGRLTADDRRIASEAAEKPGAYLKHINEAGVGFAAPETLSALDQARERLAMGLRLVEGMPLEDLAGLGFALAPAALQETLTLGLVARSGERIALTPKGRLAADRVTMMLSP